MNAISRNAKRRLAALFEAGYGVRCAAKQVGIHRDTAMRFRRAWIKSELQKAYDYLWDGNAEMCDAVNLFLPDAAVREMLDAWSDDWSDSPKDQKSHWYHSL